MRIAIYSGSFDPVHKGHISLARNIVDTCADVDRVWLLITPHNPLKDSAASASTAMRLTMARIATAPYPELEASAFEESLPEPHFTFLTLRALRHEFPQHSFSLIIGSDNWLIFHRWKNREEILARHHIYIYPRPGYPVDPATLPPNATLLSNMPVSEASSTAVRQAIAAGRVPGNMLDQEVYHYIKNHNLYGQL